MNWLYSTIVSLDNRNLVSIIDVDFGGWGSDAPLCLTLKGQNMSGCLGFLASTGNTHLATRNPKFQTEIEPQCGKDFFFWSLPEFGAKFWTEVD